MLDFLKLARDHRLSYTTDGHHHCHAGWAQTHCPNCTDGRHGFHLGFSLTRGTFNCWRCGPSRVVDTIGKLLRVSTGRAVEIVGKYGGARGPRPAAASPRRQEVPIPPGLGKCRDIHLEYLEDRGLLPNRVIEEWDLRGTRHLSGAQWNWRVVFPIYNTYSEIVAWCGRSVLPDAKPKYRMTDDEDCSEDPKTFLYGIHRVPKDTVIVVEGPGDVWSIGPGAIALLGIDWKQDQANKLRKFSKRFIMFDPEEEAQRRAEKLAEHLSLFGGDTEIISGLPSDPGSLPRSYVKKIRRELLCEGV